MEAVESTAVRIALKLQSRGYESEEKAVSALRRKHKGVSADEALALIRLAGLVLRAAIAFLKPRLRKMALELQGGKGISQKTIDEIEHEFQAVSPECSQAMRSSAISWAQYYHAR